MEYVLQENTVSGVLLLYVIFFKLNPTPVFFCVDRIFRYIF